ncbi:hypothetical protein E3P91_03158 [Wallemia ichthyophaga]|nr:hypothetical protein E3P91_03158 [Wallemia ichthyophaga]
MSTSSLSSPESSRGSDKIVVNFHDKGATKGFSDSGSEASTQPLSKSSSELSEPPEDRIKAEEAVHPAIAHEPTLASALDPIPSNIPHELAMDPPPEAVAAPTTEKEVGAGEALIDMAVDGEAEEAEPGEKVEEQLEKQQLDEEQEQDEEQHPATNPPPTEHETPQPPSPSPSHSHSHSDENTHAHTATTTGTSIAYHVDDEREDALAHLTKLEIEFAMLRNKLYVERMEDVGRESAMIADGTHPELQHLHTILAQRRDTRLSLASIRLRKLEESHKTTFRAEQTAAWTNWVEGVKQLHYGQGDKVESGSYGWGGGLQGNDRKRRRLEREKEALEVPKILQRPPIAHLAIKATQQLASLPPPQSTASKNKKRGRYPRKDHINHDKQKVSMNNWHDLNSMFGEPLSSIEDVQLARQAVDEDMMAMNVGGVRVVGAQLTHRQDRQQELHVETETDHSRLMQSSHPSPL